MLTYGFYDSKDHDRRYNALQFGSIFDGIVKDGIFMSIGTCFRVIPAENMMVLVGIGRAWFNHTWTLNDAPLPVYVPQSEVLLNRIDAIVLDVQQDQANRKNDIIVVKGTPSSNPVRPTMINTTIRHQYPLAFISVKAGATAIRAADITSMVGTSSTPYVTGILETVNIDNLIDQWTDQWARFYETKTADVQRTYDTWLLNWNNWSSAQKDEMLSTADEWKAMWDSWFYSYINQNQQANQQWEEQRNSEFQTWFDNLQAVLDDNVAANLTNLIIAVQNRVNILENFSRDLTDEQSIYKTIQDSNSPSDYVLDSDGRIIDGRIIFKIK